MKKRIALLLFGVLTWGLVGCSDNKTEESLSATNTEVEEMETTGTEASADSSAETVVATEATESVDYEAHLPDSVVLTYKDKECSDIFNMRAHDVFSTLGITVYKDHTTHNPEDFPNGIPYDVWFEGEDGNGIQQIFLEEVRLVDENDRIEMNRVSVTIFENCGYSLLGIEYGMSKEDVFNILGNYDIESEEHVKHVGTVYSYGWENVKIGDETYEYISAEFRDGIVKKVSINKRF